MGGDVVIGSEAFSGCTGLNSIFFDADSFSCEPDAFTNCPNLSILYTYEASEAEAFFKEYYPNVEIVYCTSEDQVHVVHFTHAAGSNILTSPILIADRHVAYDHLVPKPEDPTADGRTFDGWYKDWFGTQPWDFENDLMPDGPLTLYAKWKPWKSRVTITEDGTLEDITAYDTDLDLSDLSELADESGSGSEVSTPIRSLGSSCIPSGVYTLTLPDTLESVSPDAFDRSTDLQSIVVPETNTHFYTVDGVLFSSDGTLVCYPAAKSGAKYTLPSGTTGIAENAFRNNSNLAELSFPGTLRTISGRAFQHCINVVRVQFAADCDGVSQEAFGTDGFPIFLGPTDASSLTAFTDLMGIKYNYYYLTVNSDYEDTFTLLAKAGDKLPQLLSPSGKDTTITAWRYSRYGSDYVDFDNDTMPYSDLTLYAVWGYEYDYTYDDDGNVILTTYLGQDTVIRVPTTVDSSTVVSIEDGCFPTGVTLVGDKGSLAESYAKSHGLNFVEAEYELQFYVTYDNGSNFWYWKTLTCHKGDAIQVPDMVTIGSVEYDVERYRCYVEQYGWYSSYG